MNAQRSQRIAELNDRFRAALGIPSLCGGIPGQGVLTRGIGALSYDTKAQILREVRSYTQFTSDDDPYDEHDFSSLDIDGAGTVFWKIDAFEGERCQFGSEHPEDISRSYRLLTIMLAEEY